MDFGVASKEIGIDYFLEQIIIHLEQAQVWQFTVRMDLRNQSSD